MLQLLLILKMMLYEACLSKFKTPRALKSHLQGRPECMRIIEAKMIRTHNDASIDLDNNDTDTDNMDDNLSHLTDLGIASVHTQPLYITDELRNTNLFDQQLQHAASGYYQTLTQNGIHCAQSELLYLLKKAKTPLYLYDEIIKWIKATGFQYNKGTLPNELIGRTGCLTNLYNQYDLNKLQPTQSAIFLKGTKRRVMITKHNFEQCLYSILNDKNLMNENNLLFSKENLFDINKNQCTTKLELNDIDTGSVYKLAQKKYLKPNSRDLLCPIIFFIDKTFTDVQGRLCLEQIRFTLGIFNRETRNNPNAWRTLGYICDQAYLNTETTEEKLQDYHQMMNEILKEYKVCQDQKFKWVLEFENGQAIEVDFVLAVLFIIGDTDGHDKIAGRYTSRNNVARLCRCCTIPFSETDNPEYEFTYIEHKRMFKKIRKESSIELKQISHHKIKNCWKDIKFCDPERGLFGALCADILHCIQHGLFLYAHQALFGRKQAKEESIFQETDIEFSGRNVFNKNYTKRFEELSIKYGKYLAHQSDRSLPRTHINTNYTTSTRKNASEMSGVLLVILIIFLTDEGTENLDENMALIEAAKFIKTLELLLLLEMFCKTTSHDITDVKLFKEFIPFFLDIYKTTLQRKTGCGMKLVKFHLPTHFADDILRYGSMLNFDTGIGESHHKTAAKYPSKQTQHRRSEFEFQTAVRQIGKRII